MNKNVVRIGELRKKLSKSEFIRQCDMPLGYSQGIPLLLKVNDRWILRTPFLRYHITGKEDQTLVYPIRYVIDVDIASGRIASFQDLMFDPQFAEYVFSKPIGYFRHDALKKYAKADCAKLFQRLYASYDSLVLSELDARQHSAIVNDIRNCMRILLPPYLHHAYRLLDENFYAKYVSDSSMASESIKKETDEKSVVIVSDETIQQL